MKLTCVLISVLSCICPVLLNAQEIKYVDLSTVTQRIELRHPPAAPAKCNGDGSCVGAGWGGGSGTDSAPDRRDPRSLGVWLEYVSPTDITLDPFEAEFRIVNTGSVAIDIPAFPHLSDLQPQEESRPFSYVSLALVIHLDGIEPEQALGIGWIELYGATEHDGTIVALQPGEWIRVKAKLKLHTWPSKEVTARLSGHFWLRKNLFTPHDGGGFTQSTNLYPNQTPHPALIVRFTPTHSSPSDE